MGARLTLLPWTPTPGGHLCHWRLPDGRDVVAARVYRNGPKRWNAYLRDHDGRELPGMVIEGQGRKEALGMVRATLLETCPPGGSP